MASNACPWVCSVGYYVAASVSTAIGLSAAPSCIKCSNAPAQALYTGSGSAAGVCPWQCLLGNYEARGTCLPCPAGTYSATAGKLVTDGPGRLDGTIALYLCV
jgi:hypothetical protein